MQTLPHIFSLATAMRSGLAASATFNSHRLERCSFDVRIASIDYPCNGLERNSLNGISAVTPGRYCT
jgi:hypothetical protein